ncbi:formyltransferase family protein [Flavivirga aquimarina]|uniref:Formyltransferase family protein n=1 Tax=Flavivirga aquimarina TaxID=2027862 RepID=A0ABT8WDD6_9FLAO|nr:formyltransferase family protein [Flavivirga aquimarina]MDO5971148.1 formyltransferase family protein [Flavivirga aquimarina]
MVNNKKIVFLGSRIHVINELLQDVQRDDLIIYALENSFLVSYLNERNISYLTFSMRDKKACLDELLLLDFDVLISNGCPIVFPVQKFKPHQILINIHPTYLPHLQGKTPMNGVFYLNYSFYGATMHYIDKGIDTGDVICQKKEELTSDIDLGLLYHLAMKLEGWVFKEGWRKLKQANFEYIGIKQDAKSTYFNRTNEMRNLDFNNKTDILLLKIKSFGIKSQGCTAIIENEKYKIFEAERIIHEPLLKNHKDSEPGKIVLVYDEKFLVKTIDGIIKVKKYEII